MLKEWVEEVYRRRTQISGYDHEQRVNLAGIKEMLKGQEAESDKKKKKKCAVQ
ncbi:uncharacterized protein ACA1_358910 [Acanthamoeba castellanii str. Neff]|uniref:Uncharacterized protein n=1 Tax=Acanthamoeba castellanii (strain ATCC 30010 / Neff) TaxID=1257118 RepID=L8GKM9_ACACF|nr:uncharacterized protein ACA1_358910 [Acanthamoeba castellanii str. Neff]ELR13572.1 hypothetical protein ACA1_358910 [Acanthamoeba castellanii str. Neff]